MFKLERAIAGVCGIILIVLFVRAVRPAPYVPEAPEVKEEADCIGDPIMVDVPYMGAALEPWTCAEQCANDQPRYILYSNGKATQCETPPGCNDFGEDRGITCKVKTVSPKM